MIQYPSDSIELLVNLEKIVDVSICICTCNRPDSLSQSLESIHKTYPANGIAWEVLIVSEKKGAEQTRRVVDKFKSRLPIELLVKEPIGLSISRNTALNEAKGKYVFFTDDDTIVSEQWVKCMNQGIRDNGALLGFGPVLPNWPPEGKPSWLPSASRYSGVLALLDFGSRTQRIECNDENAMVGANFAVDRLAAIEIGGFHEEYGHGGRFGIGGEDTLFFRSAQAAGWPIVYVGTASVQHCITKDRMRLLHFTKWYWNYGRMLAHLSSKKYTHAHKILGIPGFTIIDIATTINKLLVTLFQAKSLEFKDNFWLSIIRIATAYEARRIGTLSRHLL
jgi:glucosyl-dolichyl phosphate glucuronosyltransferase